MFDVRRSLVTFSIKLAAAASGWADTRNLQILKT
jgi:hypothetical protein